MARGRTVKVKRRIFKGSWVLFVILLLFAIIPALIYYWLASEEIETTEKR